MLIDGDFRQGQYACSLEDVQKYLGDSEDLHYDKGLFPFTAAPIESTRFCFSTWMLISTKALLMR